jgi:hypothetical protein
MKQKYIRVRKTGTGVEIETIGLQPEEVETVVEYANRLSFEKPKEKRIGFENEEAVE